jgi:hypothetical protein
MRRCAFVLAFFAVSCGNGRDYGGRPPYPVSGKVLVNDQPVAGALVTLHDTHAGPNQPASQGTTGNDGVFVVSTYDPRDGAPASDYKVTVIWRTSRREGALDRLDHKYANPDSSGLTATVENKTNTLQPFNLSADPASIKAIEERAQDPSSVKTHHKR